MAEQGERTRTVNWDCGRNVIRMIDQRVVSERNHTSINQEENGQDQGGSDKVNPIRQATGRKIGLSNRRNPFPLYLFSGD